MITNYVQGAHNKTCPGTCEVIFVRPSLQWTRKNEAFSVYSWVTRHRQQYQNTECCRHELLWRIYVAGTPENLGYVEMKLAGQLARHGTVQQFVGPEPALVGGFSKQNTYLLTPWSRVLLEKLTGSAASQEIPRILCSPKDHYRTHKCPPSVPIPEPTPSSPHNPLPLPEEPF